MIVTVLPATRYGDPADSQLRICETTLADHEVRLHSPDTGEQFGLSACQARAMAHDLNARADCIDPTGGTS